MAITSTRVESKYLLSFEQYSELAGLCRLLLRQDQHAGPHYKYPVLSRYYDTRDARMFYAKIYGERLHVKIRARAYGIEFSPAQPVWLEAKIKSGRDQRKVRLKSDAVSSVLDPRRWTELGESSDARFFVDFAQTRPLAATANVYYEREVYEGRVGGQRVRINFDSNVIGLFPQEGRVGRRHILERQILPPKTVLLELKRDGANVPPALAQRLRRFELRPTAFSKYASSLLLLNELSPTRQLPV